MSTYYTLQGVNRLTRDEFLRVIRTRFDGEQENAVAVMQRLLPAKPELLEELLQAWETIPVYTINDVQKEQRRSWLRLLFWAIRPERFFPHCNPELLDHCRQEVDEPVWTPAGELSRRQRVREYWLYRVRGEYLGTSEDVSVLKCLCPSTGQEHWIMLDPRNTDLPETLSRLFGTHDNAVAAVQRQGDILLRRYHLPKLCDMVWSSERTAIPGEGHLQRLHACVVSES